MASLPFILSSVRLAVLCECCDATFVTEEVTDSSGVYLRSTLCDYCHGLEQEAAYFYEAAVAEWEMEHYKGL